MGEEGEQAGISHRLFDGSSTTSKFYDLQANEAQLEPQTMRERAATAIKLGYDGIAFCHQAGATLTDKDK